MVAKLAHLYVSVRGRTGDMRPNIHCSSGDCQRKNGSGCPAPGLDRKARVKQTGCLGLQKFCRPVATSAASSFPAPRELEAPICKPLRTHHLQPLPRAESMASGMAARMPAPA